MTKTIAIKKIIPYLKKMNHYSPWLLVAALYAPVFFDLYSGRWEKSDYTHAYFILPVFLWLVWHKRSLLRKCFKSINPPPPLSPSMRETGLGNIPLAEGVSGGGSVLLAEGESNGRNVACSEVEKRLGNVPLAEGEAGGGKVTLIQEEKGGGKVSLIMGESEGRDVPRWRGRRGWKNSPPLVEDVRACPVPDTGEGCELLHLRSNLVGLFILLFGVCMFIFGWRRSYLFFETLSLLPVLYGSITILYGSNVTKVLSFSILYLIFLVPLPIGIIDNITLPMRYGVSIATEALLKSFQYPITREGLLLSIGNNELFIGQPCSGFRSLITMVSAGLVYVLLSKTDFSKKIILASSIIPFALCGNLVRITMLCLITFYFGEAAGQGFFHNFSGILIIVLITIGLLGLEYFLGKYMPNTSRSMPQVVTVRQGNSSYRYTNKNLCITHALLLFAIIFCFGFPKTKEKYEGQNILSQLEIPHNIGGWQGKDVEQKWNLEEDAYHFVSHILEREYISKNGENLFLLIMDGRDFHNPKTCSKGAGFKVGELNDLEFQILNRAFTTHAIFAQKENESDGFLLIYWFCIDKNVVDWMGEKTKTLWFSLTGKQAPGIMIRLAVPCEESNIEDAIQSAKGFLAEFSQAIPGETADYLFGEIKS